MTTANQLAGYASSLPNFRNRIINGHLKSSKVINQRGASSITGATGYTYDRWYYDGSTYLYQGVEDANVPNGTYVISWEGSGISAAWKVSTDSTANNGPDATTGFTSVSNGGTFTVNETTEFSKHLWIQFSGTLSNLDKVQVELGTVATPFEHRPYGMELSLCQRYYQQLEPSIYSGTSNGTTQVASVGIPLSVAMRVTPTGGSGYIPCWHSSANVIANTTTPVFTYTAGRTSVKATINGYTGLTDNKVAVVYLDTGANVLDAEL